MIDFQIVGGRLKIDPDTLTVKAFHDIWEYDKSKTKGNASNILLYVFHMCDITQKNPFKDLPEREKDVTARYNAFGSKTHKFASLEQELINEAIKWYQVLNKDSIQRLGIGVNRKIDQVTEFMMDEKNDIKDAKQLDIQTDMIVKTEKILVAKRKIDEVIRQEIEKTKSKGNTSRSPLQKGIV